MTEETVQLSDREREILRLVATGATNQQIANDLGISVNTVKVHLRNVFGKIGVTSRTEATVYAVRVGMVNLASNNQEQDRLLPAAPEAFPAASEPATADVVAPPATDDEEVTEALPRGATSAEGEAADISAQPSRRRPRAAHLARYGVMIGTLVGGLALALIVIWLMRQPEHAVMTTPTSPTGGQQVAISELTPDWRLRTALPTVQEAAAAVSLDGNIFLIGGRTEEGITGAVWRYDPDNDTWRPLNAQPTPVTDVQAVALNGKIYVPGGETADGTISDRLEVYDPVQGSWATAASLPAPRSAYGLTALEGRVYLFGGWDGNEVRSEVFAYDPRSDTWTTQTPMPTARAYTGAVALDGKIYVIGGEDSSGPLRINEEYVPANEGRQPWTSRAPLLMPRSRFGSGALANLIYVLGGVPEAEPLYYDIRTDTWQSMPSPEIALGVQPAVAPRDASLFILSTDPEQSTSALIEFRLVYMLTVPIP
jgi:DNA-binding CsgD family transcriptional regulator